MIPKPRILDGTETVLEIQADDAVGVDVVAVEDGVGDALVAGGGVGEGPEEESLVSLQRMFWEISHFCCLLDSTDAR